MDTPTQTLPIPAPTSSNFGTQTTESKKVTRDALGLDLRSRTLYDQPSVLERLRTADVKHAFVDSCTRALSQDVAAHNAMQQLRDLAVRANESNRSNEKAMYDPLLLNFISAHGATNSQLAKANRFVRTKGLDSDMNTAHPVFPLTFPDITGISPDSDENSSLYEDRVFLAEVKAKNIDGPYPPGANQTGSSTDVTGASYSDSPSTNTDGDSDASSIANSDTSSLRVPEILCQAADYARLHMSSRPFCLFSVVLLIFGSGFCVAIFDRNGVVISPQMDMWQNLDQFIRVVRSLSSILSDVQLGQDPTVQLCSPAFKLNNRLAPNIPAFLVDPIGTNTITYDNDLNMTRPAHRWCTIGRPIWASVSLFGRGTAVWPVRACAQDILEGEVMIMKTYWCHRTREPESGLYISLAQKADYPATVARFRTGGDVKVASPDRPTISVNYLRGVFGERDESPFMHRLVLASRGRPLWTYRSDLELVQGMAAAIEGHKWLFEQGLLHCDISPGNIMLSDHQNGEKGFITDLNLAQPNEDFKVFREEIVTRQSSRPRSSLAQSSGDVTLITSSTARRGATITGTMQFMAIAILHGLVNHTRIAHTVETELEACQCVMGYVVMRSILERTAHLGDKDPLKSRRQVLGRQFKSAFGVASIDHILQSRSTAQHFAFIQTSQLPFVLGYVAEPIIALLDSFRRGLKDRAETLLYSTPTEPLKPMNHSTVLASFAACETALLRLPTTSMT